MGKKETNAKKVFHTYWQTLKHYKATIAVLLAAVLLATLSDTIAPFYYKKFFDALASPERSTRIAQTLFSVLFSLAILKFLSFIGYRIGSFLNASFQLRIMSDLKKKAYDYLMQHSHGFFLNNFTGSLVQRVNRFSHSFETLADVLYWDLIPLFIRIVAAFFAIWFFQPFFALILLIFVLIFIGINYAFTLYKLPFDLKSAEKDSEVTGALADSITNNTTVRSFTGFPYESGRFGDIMEDWRKIVLRRWNMGEYISSIQAFLFVIIELLLFYYGIRYWQKGVLSVGTFILMQTYFFQIIDRLWNFNGILRHIYEGIANAVEMVEILETPHEIQNIPNAKPLRVKKGEIMFYNVSFNYHQTRTVLNNINFTIRPGEKIALIGPSGAGKSTIIALLFRLYDVEHGKIFIDGQNIQKVTQESLREHMSLVPQDPILFHRTILENIHYGRRSATEEEVMKMAKLAHCDEFVKDFPDNYNTFVGERGVRLSGGERQRVVIARAMLKNAPILVLDEATSSLDSQSERLIQDSLDNLMKNRTTIVIAHRLSTIRKMDRIIVIEDGKVKESGSHSQLLKKEKSLYARLWKLQAGGFLMDE